MKILKWVVVTLVVVVLGVMFYADRVWTTAHLSETFWSGYSTAKVDFDAQGIPTIEADSWAKIIEAQGYVIASERFFHMDLVRRAGAGRLAELMGPGVVRWDRSHREEDWIGTADRAYAALPADQKGWVDAYAKGVNAFLIEHPDKAGIEYSILGVNPEAWRGRDSLLVLMMMAYQLSQGSESEARRAVWKEHLPAEWFGFLFPENHPYNRPLFGDAPAVAMHAPSTPLPKAAITEGEFASGPSVFSKDAIAMGAADETMAGAGASNSWAWCGSKKCFLANDPHLGATVPHIWYALRLRKSEKDWAVGVAIPGIPAITLGMNPYLAWSFTNTGEDVDDYLQEKVSEDGRQYVARLDAGGQPVWADIKVQSFEIKVRGGDLQSGEAKFTHRGPLAQRKHLGDAYYSRQWLPLQPGMLRIPTAVTRAKSWDELNVALDDMRVPAQNVVMVDHQGMIGYRASGTGVKRQITGRLPQEALQGEWLGFEPWSQRRRLTIGPTDETRSATVARFLATANQRIWVDPYGQRWSHDLRAERIRTVLSALKDATQADMAQLQMDTNSPYHFDILRWVAARAKPANDAQAAIVTGWMGWDGEAQGHPKVTAEALIVETWLNDAAVARARQAFLPKGVQETPYSARMDNAWMIHALNAPKGFEVFGYDEVELANALLHAAEVTPLMPHPEANRWQAQHPFVDNVPVLGDRFKVPEIPQAGHFDVPRVESPKYGASCRLVWNMGAPKESTWALPVGQSGHPMSPHYSDLMKGFRKGETHLVFNDAREWWFAPRGAALR